MHSGGVLADAAIPNQTLAGIRASFGPKVISGQLWERTVGVSPATMHIAFSSVAALLGSPGQANYSMANASLDAMARGWQEQASGRPPRCSPWRPLCRSTLAAGRTF